MSEKLSRFDPADYLDDPETIAGFLDEACAAGDPNEIAMALGAVARAKGINDLAREIGISGPGLRKAFSGTGNPTLGTIFSVAKALGLRLSIQPAVPPAVSVEQPTQERKTRRRA